MLNVANAQISLPVQRVFEAAVIGGEN